jgi:predicted dinucleotide-binding enzyme
VVKAFNHIMAQQIVDQRAPAGTSGRRALAIAGDDHAARDQVSSLIDQIGFDVLDLGPLEEGWRVQRDTPAYVAELDLIDLREAVSRAQRYRDR